MKKKQPTPKRTLSKREFLGAALSIGTAIGGYSLWQYLRGGPVSSPYGIEHPSLDSSVAVSQDAGADENVVDTSGQLRFDFLRRGEDKSLATVLAEGDISTVRKTSIAVTEFEKGIINPSLLQETELYMQNAGRRYVAEQYGSSSFTTKINPVGEFRFRVVPEPNLEFAQQYLNYCLGATDFLFSRKEFRDILALRPHWNLPQNQEHKSNTIPAYVGLGLFREERIFLQHVFSDGRVFNDAVVVPQGHGGGLSSGVKADVDKVTNRLIIQRVPGVIICGTYTSDYGALQVPFSEMTLLLFIDGLEKFMHQVQHTTQHLGHYDFVRNLQDQSEKLGEAITESVSIYLTKSLIQEPAMRNVLHYTSPPRVEQRGLKLGKNEGYSLLPPAYKYLQKHGLAHVVNLFMDDPSRYMREIQKM